MRILWAITVGALAGGCSVIVGFDGLTNGGSDAGAFPSDGSTPPDGAPSTDASLDAPNPLNVDAPGGRFCPRDGAVLCSDFDDPNIDAAIPGPWDFSYAPNTLIEVATTEWVSAPRSLFVQTNDTAYSSAVVKTVQIHAGVTLSFDVFVTDGGGNPGVATINCGNGSLVFQPYKTYSEILEALLESDGGYLYSSDVGSEITWGTWFHIDMDVDVMALTSVVKVNGAPTITHKLSFTSEWSGATSAMIALGIGNSNNASVYYDNVTIETR